MFCLGASVEISHEFLDQPGHGSLLKRKQSNKRCIYFHDDKNYINHTRGKSTKCRSAKTFSSFFFSKRVLLADLDKLIVYHRQWVGGKCTQKATPLYYLFLFSTCLLYFIVQLTMMSKLLKYSVATASSSKFSGFPQTGHTRCIIFLSRIVIVINCVTQSRQTLC